MRHVLLVLAATLVAAGEASVLGGFRGDGGGRFPEAAPPLTWSRTANVAWSTELPGWSNASPLLLGDLVVTCSEPGSLIGVGAADGKVRWTCSDDPGRPLPKSHKENGYTTASPTSDGTRIFTVFGSGRVVACDAGGKKLWAVDLEVPPNAWGSCMSPRLAGGLLIVHIDQLWGLDPATGAVRWKVKTPWTWGTPVVVHAAAGDLVWTGGGAAFHARDGSPAASGPPKLEYNSPCVAGDVLYGVQTVPTAFRLGADGKATELWRGAIAKDRYYASPLVHDGLVYAISQKAQLSVLDAATGALVYERKVDALKGTVYPSPSLAGAVIHLASAGGQTVVIAPGRTYQELAVNELEPTRGCALFAGKRMLVRGDKHLWCIAAP